MTDSPTDRFVETLGMINQSEGLPRISGQILAFLLLSDEPRSLNDIAGALDISKASASTNTRLLEARGMASKVSRKGSRLDLWIVEPYPHMKMLPGLAERFRRYARTVEEIAADFPEAEAHKRHKVTEFATFYRDTADFFEAWSARLAADPSRSRNTN
ncbi:GbsR/MarR family transcriptional regulator [Pseudooceanicola sp. LIPI14-2-Ac024]|uniref:GbsR/MarR family transcriptional regulator n=1 Tax=Pseudooceanicola sp. LIPI14-2-Ac024 TaxID=3344875 RepID=UPI0035CF6E85